MPANVLSLKRQSEIIDIINNLKLTYNLSYPEDGLLDIIKKVVPNVLVQESDFDGDPHIRGAVFRQSKAYARPVIAIHSDQSSGSKTFTLAHEFAHYILNHNPRANYYLDDMKFDGTKRMQDEGEANFFAQILLMPKQLFQKLDVPFVDDQKIADFFGVTKGSVRVRREWLSRNGY